MEDGKSIGGGELKGKITGRLVLVLRIPLAAVLMFAALVPFSMVAMMAAMHVRIISEVSGQQSVHSIIGAASYTSIEGDSGFCQRILCAGANASTNQRVNVQIREQNCKCAMAAAFCAYNFCICNFPVCNVIYFELFGMPEVLKNISIFISNCNFHNIYSLSYDFLQKLTRLLQIYLYEVYTARAS